MHLTKYRASSCGQIIKHINRERENFTYGNEEIDPTRTHLNWKITQTANAHIDGVRALFDCQKIAGELGQQRKGSDVAMCSIIVTLPKDYVKKKKAWQDEFFKNTFNHLAEKFEVVQNGKTNILCSAVHYDETTPHIHFSFVPVVSSDCTRRYKDRKGNWRGTEQKRGFISAKAVVDMACMRSLHSDLDKYLFEHQKGYKGGILLDDEQKIDKALMKPASELKQQPEEYLKQCRKFSKGLRANRRRAEAERDKLINENLRRENEELLKDNEERKEYLDRYEKDIQQREIKANERGQAIAVKERELQEKENQLNNWVNEYMTRKAELIKGIKDHNQHAEKLSKSIAEHKAELEELKTIKERKKELNDRIKEWNDNKPKRDSIRQEQKELKQYLEDNKGKQEELKQVNLQLNSAKEELEQTNKILNRNINILDSSDKLAVFKIVDELDEKSMYAVIQQLEKSKYGEKFAELYVTGKEINDKIKKKQERERQREREYSHERSR